MDLQVRVRHQTRIDGLSIPRRANFSNICLHAKHDKQSGKSNEELKSFRQKY